MHPSQEAGTTGPGHACGVRVGSVVLSHGEARFAGDRAVWHAVLLTDVLSFARLWLPPSRLEDEASKLRIQRMCSGDAVVSPIAMRSAEQQSALFEPLKLTPDGVLTFPDEARQLSAVVFFGGMD